MPGTGGKPGSPGTGEASGFKGKGRPGISGTGILSRGFPGASGTAGFSGEGTSGMSGATGESSISGTDKLPGRSGSNGLTGFFEADGASVESGTEAFFDGFSGGSGTAGSRVWGTGIRTEGSGTISNASSGGAYSRIFAVSGTARVMSDVGSPVPYSTRLSFTCSKNSTLPSKKRIWPPAPW